MATDKPKMDLTGTIQWLPSAFALLPDSEIDRTDLNKGAADHPFAVIKTYGPNANVVLGCVCTGSYEVRYCAVPIAGTGFDRKCGTTCESFPEGVLFPNPQMLGCSGAPEFDTHTHVMFDKFGIIDRSILRCMREADTPYDFRLSSDSMDWILKTFADKIASAEKKSYVLRQLLANSPAGQTSESSLTASANSSETSLQSLGSTSESEDDSNDWKASEDDAGASESLIQKGLEEDLEENSEKDEDSSDGCASSGDDAEANN